MDNNEKEVLQEEILKEDIVFEEQDKQIKNDTNEKSTIETEDRTESEAIIEYDMSLEEGDNNNASEDSSLAFNDSEKDHSQNANNKRQRNKWIKLVAIVIVAIFIIVWGLHVIGNQIVALEASYKDGNSGEGVVLDTSNDNIQVTGVKRFGGRRALNSDEWTITEPVTLEKDKTSSVTITYKKLSTTLEVNCTDSAVVDFDAEYKGETEAGTVINDDSPFQITVKYKNGKQDQNYSEWHLKKSVTLEVDSSAEVEILIEDVTKTVTIECSTHTPKSIKASYDGNISEGTILNNKNSGITVIATYEDGTEENINEYTIPDEKTLKRGKTSTVTIEYLGKTCELSVKASNKQFFKKTFKELMEEYNSTNKYDMSIYRDEKDDDWGNRCYTYDGKEVSYFIDLQSGTDFNADIFFSDEDSSINRNADISTKEDSSFNKLKIYLYDNTTDQYDSSIAAVALKLGQNMAKILGYDFDPEKMAKDGDKYSFNNYISIDYEKDGCEYSLSGDRIDGYLKKRYQYTFEMELTEDESDEEISDKEESDNASGGAYYSGYFDRPGN